MTAKKIIDNLRDKKDFVFLIGNGINDQYCKNNVSWNKLMQKIANNVGADIDFLEGVEDIKTIGLTNPEFFNILEGSNSSLQVRNALYDCMGEYSKDKIPVVVSSLKDWNVPVLTTNYDLRMHEGKRMVMRDSDGKGFRRYYPFYSYYAEREVKDVRNDFAFWHIHGAYEERGRLQISLNNYLHYCAHTQPFVDNLFKSKDGRPDEWCEKSWVYSFMTKPLLIVGLGLDSDEVFLRWLLIKRRQLMKERVSKPISYYACTEKDLPVGKKYFLEQVGITPLVFNDYNKLNQNIFENK